MEKKITAKWTDDCQGKKDFDGEIVVISTRYWPSRDYSKIGGAITKPSAGSAIEIRHKNHNPQEVCDNATVLISQDFEADSELEVKKQVEDWAQVQFSRVFKALEMEFKLESNG